MINLIRYEIRPRESLCQAVPVNPPTKFMCRDISNSIPVDGLKNQRKRTRSLSYSKRDERKQTHKRTNPSYGF